MKLALIAFFLLALPACNTLTPAQQANLFCAISADGVTVTAIFANPTQAAKAGAVQVVACTAASQVGAAVK